MILAVAPGSGPRSAPTRPRTSSRSSPLGPASRLCAPPLMRGDRLPCFSALKLPIGGAHRRPPSRGIPYAYHNSGCGRSASGRFRLKPVGKGLKGPFSGAFCSKGALPKVRRLNSTTPCGRGPQDAHFWACAPPGSVNGPYWLTNPPIYSTQHGRNTEVRFSFVQQCPSAPSAGADETIFLVRRSRPARASELNDLSRLRHPRPGMKKFLWPNAIDQSQFKTNETGLSVCPGRS